MTRMLGERRTSIAPWAVLVQRARNFGAENWLFYSAFALCAFTTLIVRTCFWTVLFVPKDIFEAVAYLVCALMLLAKLLLRPDWSRSFALALAIMMVGAISLYVVHAWRFSLLFFFIAAGEGVSLRRLALIVLVVQLAVMAVILPCAWTGRIDSVYVNRFANGQWYTRSSYGYSHPNKLGQAFFVVAISYAALRFPRFRPVDLLVYAAAGLAAVLLVQARTAVACIVLTALLACAAPYIVARKSRQRLACALALGAFCGLALMSYGFMVFYDESIAWMSSLDSLLSTRFSLAHSFFEVFPPRPFGREFMAVKTAEILQEAPDNAYVRMLVKQGVVPAVTLGALCLAAYVQALRKGVYHAGVFGLLVYAVGAVMEMYAINFTLNYFLIACSWALFGSWPKEVASDDG